MYESHEILSDTFTAHEHLTPDTADVLTKVDAIATTHRRNRWALRATGVSLVSAGVVAGAIGLPGLLSNHSASNGGRARVLSPAAQPAADPTTVAYTSDQETTAYFNAGYDYDNAVALGQLWQMTDLDAVKAEAGGKLLAGETLPVTPDNPPAPPENAAVNTFFSDGYDYGDAVKLAALWNVSSYQAKIDGGKKLEQGETLPVPPSGPTTIAGTATVSTRMLSKAAARRLVIAKKDGQLVVSRKVLVPGGTTGSTSEDAESPALTKYFDAGYDYDDAVKLGQAWHETDINQIKSEAGQKLLDGDTLPVPPSGSPAPPENTAVDTFFADGYTIDDAIQLGQIWNVSTYQAKIDGGNKLENGETLPIQPGS